MWVWFEFVELTLIEAKFLYLTWNKEDNLKKSSKVRVGLKKKIVKKKNRLWEKIDQQILRKKKQFVQKLTKIDLKEYILKITHLTLFCCF